MENNNTAEQAARQPRRQPKPRPQQGAQNKTEAKNRIIKTRAPRKPFFRRKPNVHAEHRNPLAQKLVTDISGLLGRSLKVIIPWVLFSLLVFTAGAYFVFNTAMQSGNYPLWYNILLALFIFGFYGLFGLLYGVIMAMLYSVKIFSENFRTIIREAVQRVKNSIESRIDNISETISQGDVARVVKQTFEELSGNIRRSAAFSASGVFAIAALITIIFLARKAFLKSVSHVKNKAEFFALFSARVTLVLAVILNLTFFTRLAIVFWYLAGLIVILSQVIAVALIK